MPDIPAAELDVTVELVRTLLTEQHPDLADLPLRIVANGWDNVMLRLGNDLAVRIPRREFAAPLLVHELDWLPRLAPHLPVSVPAPVRSGAPGHGFPWRWSVVPWFEGQALTTVAVADRGPLAAPLAEFFASLHLPAPAEAPVSEVRGVPLTTRASFVQARLERVADTVALEPIWESALATRSWTAPPVWVHGDPHPANIVIDQSPTTAGRDAGRVRLHAIVDFGDLTAGDPASDLATAWLTFNATDRASFQDRYDALAGEHTDLWQRARGWAVHLTLMFLTECDDVPALREIGEHGLRELSAEG